MYSCHYGLSISSIRPGPIYGIKSKAAISLPFNIHCKVIAALFFIPLCCPISRVLFVGVAKIFCPTRNVFGIQISWAAKCWLHWQRERWFCEYQNVLYFVQYQIGGHCHITYLSASETMFSTVRNVYIFRFWTVLSASETMYSTVRNLLVPACITHIFRARLLCIEPHGTHLRWHTGDYLCARMNTSLTISFNLLMNKV